MTRSMLDELRFDDWDNPLTKGDLALFEHRLELRRYDRILKAVMVSLWIAAVTSVAIAIAVGK